MLGFLLARAGIDVIVLEKHADFLHDFRGDTIHPSTLEIMASLACSTSFSNRRTRKQRPSAPSSAIVNMRLPISGICRPAASSWH